MDFLMNSAVFLGIYFISLLFPAPSSSSFSKSNCNPTDSLAGNRGPFQNEPSQAPQNLLNVKDSSAHPPEQNVRSDSPFYLTSLLHWLLGWTHIFQSMGKNYAECDDGAFIYRVLNFPPFRGYENKRGTHFILEALDPDHFWTFKRPGIVQISLSQPIFISGMALKHIVHQHDSNKMGKAPKNFELYAFNEIQEQEGTAPLIFLGKFIFSDYMKGHQNFVLKEPTTQKFAQIELRFLDSHDEGRLVDVHKVEIYGQP